MNPTPTSLANALDRAVAILDGAGVPNARVDAELLVGHVLGLSRGGVQAKVALDAAIGAEDAV
ncbi:MAG: peptide chain release factor N(5)-glutamine methyltransferase, partial [Salinibacterium sp.]|nr:peptide chain release factor N(5)-glutamine methyltransferase [Salinibacterium sp.]